jgi:phage gp37-like protein
LIVAVLLEEESVEGRKGSKGEEEDESLLTAVKDAMAVFVSWE